MTPEGTPRQRYLRRLGALQGERSSWDAHWRDLNDYLLPRRARFNVTDRNQGRKLNSHIINSSPLIAVRTLSAGMMAGLTSPARPWFTLTTPDPDLAEFPRVRQWLDIVLERMRSVLLKSNLYNVLPLIYQDLAVFGTAAAIIDGDPEDAVRGYVLPTGTFCLQSNARQAIDTLYRETSRTYGQLVEEFGSANCSNNVREQVKRGNVDAWVEVCHVIEPNSDYTAGKIGPRGHKFSSTWFEKSKSAGEGFLRQRGYKTNPLIAVRWDTLDGDVYGRSPGMDALGDAKALQHLEKKKLTQIDKLADPPMRAPTALRNSRVSMLPGDVTYVDQMAGGATYEPAQKIEPMGIQVTGNEIQNHVARINTVFYADLWLMLAQSDARMTAREVAERHEEKLVQLGPVLERLNGELLNPTIDRIFDVMTDEMMFPPAPPELAGADLRVEYTSILATAQKLINTAGLERTSGMVIQLAAVKPEALDKLDEDKFIDEYSAACGVKPGVIRSADDVAKIRDARIKAQQQQVQAQQAVQGVQAAQTLSQTDTSQKNGLTDMLRLLGAPTGAAA